MIFDKLRTKKATIFWKHLHWNHFRNAATSHLRTQITMSQHLGFRKTFGEVTGKLLQCRHILCMIVYGWWSPLVWSACLVKVVGFCRHFIRDYIVIRWFFPLPRSCHEHPWSTHQHASPRKDGCLGVVIHKLFQGVGREILLVLGEECHLAKTGDDHGWMRWEWIFVRVIVEHKKKVD